MREAKHTPGPWGTDGRQTVTAPALPHHGVADETVSIALIYQQNTNNPLDPLSDEAEGNLALVMVAPDLLAVVKSFVDETVDYATRNHLGDPEQQHNVKWAREIIAKAEGGQS